MRLKYRLRLEAVEEGGEGGAVTLRQGFTGMTKGTNLLTTSVVQVKRDIAQLLQHLTADQVVSGSNKLLLIKYIVIILVGH